MQHKRIFISSAQSEFIEIFQQCKKVSLKSLEFVEEEDFRVILWRNRQSVRQIVERASIKHPSSTHQASIKYSSSILQLLLVINEIKIKTKNDILKNQAQSGSKK